ncbi:MAG TPA: dTDP-4-dehydrorhamnose reductase [Xanthomonadales bacterium]|nr:dTDP-4-dehydrorhamnose reductase [Xanthomonadales bacterium]
MTIFLTGASGQLGTELNSALTDSHSIVSSDVLPPRHRVQRFHSLNLGDEKAVTGLLNEVKPRVIVNAAAYTQVDKAESESDLAFQINASAPALLAGWARENNAFLLHYSTDYVFDGHSDRPYLESDKPSPLNAYGESKLGGEQAILSSGCDHVILRTSWIYSSHGNNFLRTMLRLASERSHLNVVDDQFGCPTWARNLAQVSAVVIEAMTGAGQGPNHTRPDSGLYHYSDGPPCTWCDFARVIFEAAVTRGILARAPQVDGVTSDQFQTAATRPRNSVLDTSKISRVFRIEPAELRPSLSDCLEDLSIDD